MNPSVSVFPRHPPFSSPATLGQGFIISHLHFFQVPLLSIGVPVSQFTHSLRLASLNYSSVPVLRTLLPSPSSQRPSNHGFSLSSTFVSREPPTWTPRVCQYSNMCLTLSYDHVLFQTATFFDNIHYLSFSLPTRSPSLRPSPNSKRFLETSSGHFLSFPLNFPQSSICDSLMTHTFLLYGLCECLTFLIKRTSSPLNMACPSPSI